MTSLAQSTNAVEVGKEHSPEVATPVPAEDIIETMVPIRPRAQEH